MYTYKLSVLLTTYNQEKYIAQAIESILDQKTDFDFEIIVSDDFSTDNTPQIIEKYRSENPDKMKVLNNEKNLGVTKNFQRGLVACQGEYIAILEGDDYWICSRKLQKQVYYLIENPQCSMCFNGLLFFRNRENVYQNAPEFDRMFYDTKDLIQTNWIGNFSTCMYRNEVVKKLSPKLYDTFTVDWMFNIACSEFGLLGCIPMQMTAYRTHSEGVWTSKTDLEAAKELVRLIPIYDEILDFRHTENFTKKLIFMKKYRNLVSNPPSKFYGLLKKITPRIAVNMLKKLDESVRLFFMKKGK